MVNLNYYKFKPINRNMQPFSDYSFLNAYIKIAVNWNPYNYKLKSTHNN